MKLERAGKTGTIDRRVRRTRALLQDALIALIPKRGYAAITVEDLCQKANIGRSTFYTHYASKDELRRATIDARLPRGRHPSTNQNANHLFVFSLPMFEHAHAFRHLHRALIASSDDGLHDEFRVRIRRAVHRELTAKRIGDVGVPIDFEVEFISGAFLAVLTWWVAEEKDLSPVEVDGLFQKLAAKGLCALPRK